MTDQYDFVFAPKDRRHEALEQELVGEPPEQERLEQERLEQERLEQERLEREAARAGAAGAGTAGAGAAGAGAAGEGAPGAGAAQRLAANPLSLHVSHRPRIAVTAWLFRDGQKALTDSQMLVAAGDGFADLDIYLIDATTREEKERLTERRNSRLPVLSPDRRSMIYVHRRGCRATPASPPHRLCHRRDR